MSDPVMHVVAGPNGAGKSTFYRRILSPITHLGLVNADVIASQEWPGREVAYSYEAAKLAAADRQERIEARQSFATETVFSHESKLALLRRAKDAGYLVILHILLVSEDLAVARVGDRMRAGGHEVPEDKIRARYRRLWTQLAAAIQVADETRVYDNSRARPFVPVAIYVNGNLASSRDWPSWTPAELPR